MSSEGRTVRVCPECGSEEARHTGGILTDDLDWYSCPDCGWSYTAGYGEGDPRPQKVIA